MKKLFSILFALLLAASMLSGCSSDDTAADADDTTTSGEETAESGAAEISGDIMPCSTRNIPRRMPNTIALAPKK